MFFLPSMGHTAGWTDDGLCIRTFLYMFLSLNKDMFINFIQFHLSISKLVNYQSNQK